ncbi:MAG: hypothetical protein IPH43_06615 [Xanthomonadales bacterium]|nr:hypothetical protein [Xanthomonadales bacterium]
MRSPLLGPNRLETGFLLRNRLSEHIEHGIVAAEIRASEMRDIKQQHANHHNERSDDRELCNADQSGVQPGAAEFVVCFTNTPTLTNTRRFDRSSSD